MRHTFGADLASFTMGLTDADVDTGTGQTGKGAVIVAAETVTFWNAQYGGQQYTDLLEATTGGPDDQGGQAISSVLTSPGADGDPPYGSIPMLLGPDGVTVMWAQVGDVDANASAPAGDGSDTTGGDDNADVTDDDSGITEDEATAAAAGEVDDAGDPIPDDDTADDDNSDDTGDDDTGATSDDDTGDTDDGGAEVGSSVDSGLRMMIVASTAGLQLISELQEFKDDIEPRVAALEDSQAVQDTHLQLHDDQIAELQTRSGGSGGGLVTGHTSERGTATLGAQFLDIDTNRIWTGINTSDGSGPVWAPPPGTAVFKARQTSQQTIAAVDSPTLAWQAIDYDLLGGWVSANPTRFTPDVPGFYLLQGVVGFSANSQANPGYFCYITWKLNGSIIAGGTTAHAGGLNWSLAANARNISVYLNGTSDRIEMVVHTNAGIDMTTAVTSALQSQVNITYQGGSGGEP